MKDQYKTIEEYILSFPPETQNILSEMRRVIGKAAPGAKEAMSYQLPTFKLNGKNLVHFAAYKNHIGFYPVPSGIAAFKEELSPYIKGKGTLQFPLDEPIPYELVKKVVKFRVTESQQN